MKVWSAIPVVRSLVLVLALGGAVAHAATVTFVGMVTNDAGGAISQWRTAGTAKRFDADGDNRYGSTGRLFYKVQGAYPAYLSYGGSQSQVGPYAGYAVVDHPDGVSADRQVCTTSSGGVAPGSVQNMFWFNITTAPPAWGFRVGVVFDGLDGAQYSPQEIRLTQLLGGSASAAVNVEPARNNTLDMVFFDVVGAVPGDRFAVQGVAGAGGLATHQIVTWDNIAPPPLRAGDVIAVDFSSAGGSGARYNVFNAAGTIAAGSVINYTNGRPVAGVSLTLTGSTLGFNNDAGANMWPGTGADPYYVNEADDIIYGTAITLAFAGLDHAADYNVRAYSFINNNGPMVDGFRVTDGSGNRTVTNSRGYRWNAGSLEAAGMVFSRLATDGGGNIVLQAFPVGGNCFLNAVVLEVVAPTQGTIFIVR